MDMCFLQEVAFHVEACYYIESDFLEEAQIAALRAAPRGSQAAAAGAALRGNTHWREGLFHIKLLVNTWQPFVAWVLPLLPCMLLARAGSKIGLA